MWIIQALCTCKHKSGLGESTAQRSCESGRKLKNNMAAVLRCQCCAGRAQLCGTGVHLAFLWKFWLFSMMNSDFVVAFLTTLLRY